MTRRCLRRPSSGGHAAAMAKVLVAALTLTAGCSNTGLAGKVTTTTAADKTATSNTTSPEGTAPGGTGGAGGGAGGAAKQPDGFLVFQNLETPSTLWTIHADGTAKKQLPAVTGQVLTAPLLSPDGSQLAFEATPAPADPATPAQPKLWVSRSDGTEAHPLSTDGVADSCAAWSPDGSRLLSSTLDPSTGKTVSRMFAVAPLPPAPAGPGSKTPPGGSAGSTTSTTPPSSTAPPSTVPPAPIPVPIDAFGLVCPVFFDANTLAYATTSPPPPASAPPTTAPPSTATTPPLAAARVDTIMSVHLDGSPGDLLTTIAGCTITDVRVAPAGGAVAFSAQCDDASASGAYLVGADRQPSIVVPGSSGAFTWSPDVAWLAYRRTDPANPLASTEILIAHSNGAEPRRLIGPANQAPTWGPLPSGGASDRRI